jgi:ankyrin repeat protein
MLLSRGANPAATDKHNNAPLHIATLYGHLQIVRTLLKYDADIFQKGEWDAVPPHIAAREGHIHLIQLFCKRYIGNANVKIPCFPDAREKALLHLAAEHAHVETVVALLDQFEADVALKDSDGNTPLHCVVLSPYDTHRMQDKDAFNETARMLIKFDSPINEKNEFGDTPLHLAAMHHFQRIVEMLLAMGANPFAENNEKLKPIDLVPDSDPMTKQILKTAMSTPKGAVNATLERLRRELDLTPMGHHQSQMMSTSHGGRSSAMNGSVMQQNGRSSTLSGSNNGKERCKADKRATISTNADSLSLASDNEDPNQSHLPLPLLPPLPQSSPEDQLRHEAAQRRTMEKEKQRAKKAALKQQQQLLQQQQQELANNAAIYHNRTQAVENEIAMHESLEHVPRRREKKPPAPEPIVMDDDETNTTVSTVMTQDTYGQQLNQEAISHMAAKLARKKLREQQKLHRDSANDSLYSEDVLYEQQQELNRVVAKSASPESKKKKSSKKQREDIVYQNFDNLGLQQIKVAHQPARDSRQSVTSETTTITDDLETEVKRRQHRHRHRHHDRRRSDGSEQSYVVRPVRDKPGTIEVQYRGGPITIAVDTQGNACTLEHLTGLQQIVQQFGNPTVLEGTEGMPVSGNKMAANDEGTLPERTSEYMDDEMTIITNDPFEQESTVSDDILGQGRKQAGGASGSYGTPTANASSTKPTGGGSAASVQPVRPPVTQSKPVVTAPKPQVSNQLPTTTGSSVGGGGRSYTQPGKGPQGLRGSDSLDDVSSDDTPAQPPVTEFSSFADKLAWAKQMSKGKMAVGSSDSSIDQSKVQVLPSPDSEKKFPQQRAPHDYKMGGSAGALDRYPSTSSGDASPAQSSAMRRRWSSNRNSDDEAVQVVKVLDVSRMERLQTEVLPARDVNRKLETKVLQAVIERADVKIDKASIVVGQGVEQASSFVENKRDEVEVIDAQKSKESKYFSLESLRTADSVARESAQSPGATSLGSGSGRSKGLKLKVDGEVPKAHDKESIQPARTAFMHAKPVSIVSSSDASDVDEGYRRSSRDISKSPRDRAEGKSSGESVERLAETAAGQKSALAADTVTKPLELAGYVKPYESFGEIKVQTDALDEEMAKFSSEEDLSMSMSEDDEDERPTTETTTGGETRGSFTAIGQSDTQGSFGSSYSLDTTGAIKAREFDSANVSHAEVIDVLFNYSDSDFSESEHYHNLTNEISTHSNVPVIQAKVIPVKATEIKAQKPTDVAKVIPTTSTESETSLSVEDLTGSPGSKRRGNKAAQKQPLQQKPSKESVADRSFLADEEVALINEFSDAKKGPKGKQQQQPPQQVVRKKTPDADDMLGSSKKPKPPIAEKPKALTAPKLVATATQTPTMAQSPVPKVPSRPNSASRMSPDVKITVVGDAKITAGGVVVSTPSPHFDEKPATPKHHKEKSSSSKKNRSRASDSERDESYQEPSTSSRRSKDKDGKKKKKKSSSKERSEGKTAVDKLKRSEADRGSASSVDTLDVPIPHAVKGELTLPAKKLPMAVVKVQEEDRDESSQGSFDLDVSIPTVFREEPIGDVFAGKKKQKEQQKLLAAAAASQAAKLKKTQETDLDHRDDDEVAERHRRKEEKKAGKRSKSKEKKAPTPTKSSAKSKDWQAREDQQEEMERVLRTLSGKVPDRAAQKSSKYKQRRGRDRDEESDEEDVEISYSDEDDDEYESRHPVYISPDMHEAQQKHSRLEVRDPQPRSVGANDKIFRPKPVYRHGSKPLLFAKPPKGREADNQSPIIMRKSASKYRGS